MSPHASQSPLEQDDRFASWRERTLAAAGFDDGLARRLAGERAVDLHALLELVDRGCPPRLAARILAPLGWEDE